MENEISVFIGKIDSLEKEKTVFYYIKQGP